MKSESVSMLISIIVPVYNRADYISRCIKSIEQCYVDNYECIIVDDGSTDETAHICDNFSEQNHNIQVIHIANSGVSNARNIGISVAKGEYITFVDSDDYIKKIDFGFLKTNHDLYVLNMGSSDGNTEKFIKHKAFDRLEQNFVEFPNLMNSVCNKLFKKSIVDEHSIRFNKEYFYSEDLLFVTNYLSYTSKYKFVNLNYYVYYENPCSATHEYTREKLESNIRACNDACNYIRGSNAFASPEYLVDYLNMNNIVQYLINPYTYAPEKYRAFNPRKKIWHFGKRLDLLLITALANIHIDVPAWIYVSIKKRHKNKYN